MSSFKKERCNDSKGKKQEPQCECPICYEVIIDRPNENHQPSIFCEGECQSWLHKSCAGLTEQAFKYFSKSTIPYQCLHCTIKQQKTELEQLKQILTALSEEVSQLKSTTKQISNSNSNSANQAAQSSKASATKVRIPSNTSKTTQNVPASGSKFNTTQARSIESASVKSSVL